MKIIQFLGGLGNQMFQYAFYKALKKRFPNVKADLSGYENYSLHNGFELEHVFDVSLDKASPFVSHIYNKANKKWIFRKLRRLLNLRNAYHKEKHLFSFDEKVLANQKPGYYWGYWQNQLYFKDIAQEIRNDFTFTLPIDQQNQQILNQINETNSVSIHVRRGDYIQDSLLGGLCSEEYYKNAIQLVLSKIPSAKFFIFSDDIPWCLENLNLEDSTFISWNKNSSSYIDMQLMSCCKHNIIANSSFSWWGAWLNSNPQKIVIGPKKWINNQRFNTDTLLPETWIKL